jgi:hypothetical protein
MFVDATVGRNPAIGTSALLLPEGVYVGDSNREAFPKTFSIPILSIMMPIPLVTNARVFLTLVSLEFWYWVYSLGQSYCASTR